MIEQRLAHHIHLALTEPEFKQLCDYEIKTYGEICHALFLRDAMNTIAGIQTRKRDMHLPKKVYKE